MIEIKNLTNFFINNKGFTLVEVLLAFAIIAMVTLAAGNFFSEGIRGRIEERDRTRAVEGLNSILEEIVSDDDIRDENNEDDIQDYIIDKILPKSPYDEVNIYENADDNIADDYIIVEENDNNLDGYDITIVYPYFNEGDEDNEQTIELTTIISDD